MTAGGLVGLKLNGTLNMLGNKPNFDVVFAYFEKISALRFFQITALSLGLATIFVIPPFQVPDEPDHFKRAFHLADGHFFGEQKEQRLGGAVPESILQLEAIYQTLKFDETAKQTAARFEAARTIALNPAAKIFQDFPNTGLYPFSTYLPQILAVKAGVLMGLSILNLLYLTRVCTLLFWIFLISKSIQITPAYKWAFAFLALLPSSLFINASASGDVVTNGLAFLVLAIFYRIIIEKSKKTSGPQMAWLTLGIGILSLNKFVYAPILLLSFLFPKSAFEQPKYRNWFAWALLLFALALVAVWNLKTSALFVPKDAYNPLFKETVTLNEGVDPKAQLGFILQHPIQFLKILSLSYLETAQATLAHYFGKFGWGKNYLPGWTIGLLLLSTVFLFLRKEGPELSNKAKITFFAVATAMTIGLAATLYLMWAPVGHERIHSISGRYFIPILPLVWLALPKIFNFKYHRQLVVLVSLSALTIGLLSAFFRYY